MQNLEQTVPRLPAAFFYFQQRDETCLPRAVKMVTHFAPTPGSKRR